MELDGIDFKLICILCSRIFIIISHSLMIKINNDRDESGEDRRCQFGIVAQAISHSYYLGAKSSSNKK